MLAALARWWKRWRANKREHEIERADVGQNRTHDGPGGWTPIGDLSKLSDDE